MRQIYETNDIDVIFDYLIEKNIISNIPSICENCNCNFKIRKRNDTADKYTWRCTKCLHFKSIRCNSILEGYRFPLTKVLKLIYAWSMEHKIIDVSNSLVLSKPTVISVISFYQVLRDIATRAVDSDNFVIGGPGKIVEVDESLFTKIKHFRGSQFHIKRIRVLGSIERDSRNCFFFVSILIISYQLV